MGPSRQSWRDRVLPPPKRAPQSHGAMFWHIRLELLARHRLERNHSCYMPELERRVKFEEAISAKRRGWHSPFRTICAARSEEHTSELQSLRHLVCRLLLE